MDDFIKELYFSSISFNGENSIIYFLFDKDKVVYIGKSIRGQRRIREHADKKFDSYNFVEVEKERLDKVEKEMIMRYKPKYNSPKDKTDEKLMSVGTLTNFKVGADKICKCLENSDIELIKGSTSMFLKVSDKEKAKNYLRFKGLSK